MSASFQRFFNRVDDFLTGLQPGSSARFSASVLTRDGHAVAIHEALFQKDTSSLRACHRRRANLLEHTGRSVSSRPSTARGRSLFESHRSKAALPRHVPWRSNAGPRWLNRPVPITTTIAFSNARRVMMSRGLMSFSNSCGCAAPAENIRRAWPDPRPESRSCKAATCRSPQLPKPSCWQCTCLRKRRPGMHAAQCRVAFLRRSAGEIASP